MGRFQEIDLYGNKSSQLNLFTSIEDNKSLNPSSFWPKYARGKKFVYEVLEKPTDYLGLDFEFDPKKNKPTIIGVANGVLSASCSFEPEILKQIINFAKLEVTKLVGYSVPGAEKTIIDTFIGKDSPLEWYEDGIITHFLLNQALIKMKTKDTYEKGSLGFLNLWTMNTFYVGLPQFKMCRGVECSGPCPSHDVFGYNAMDSYVAREGFIAMLAEMKRKNISYSFYRDVLDVCEIGQLMEKNGVRVNRELVERLDKVTDQEKEKLFPAEMKGKKKQYKYFNPNSSISAKKYFEQYDISLPNFDLVSISAALEEVADELNYPSKIDMMADIDNLSVPHQLLVKSYLYKDTGKGFKAWFSDKFFAEDGFLHPRFIFIGTSTGRGASRDPNLQNIPSFDEDKPANEQSPFSQARVAIIAKQETDCLIKADKSNLEYRMCMWYAGFPVKQIEKDAFQWIVNVSEGAFKEASVFLGKTERFVAKSMAHGSNYGEGIMVLYPKDFERRQIKEEIACGALVVYEGWQYNGGTIAFNGVNLAQRLFKDTSLEARAKANALLEGKYFGKFPMIRKWQQKVLTEVENTGRIVSATGRFIELHDEPLECAKQAFSFLGQGTSADHVQGDMLVFKKRYGADGIPLLQVHDELVFEKPKSWTDEECVSFLSIMEEDDLRIPGFWCPVKMYRGMNWAEITRIK